MVIHISCKRFACWLCGGCAAALYSYKNRETRQIFFVSCYEQLAVATSNSFEDEAALRSSQAPLGAYFRRICVRMDKLMAVTTAAHKLARLICTMLTKGEEYTDQGRRYYEDRYRQRVLHHLTLRAGTMGMKLVEAEPCA